MHRDHLGSVEATSNRLGKFIGRFAFDPWGERRKDDWENKDQNYQEAIDKRTFESTTKGFTDHEHLDAVGLIHMNGRVYDPIIGRFLSPDDYVQFPESSQSYNRYTYVLNNPLSYTDPSGEFIPLVVVGVIWAVKAYDAYTTIEDVHSTITDNNLGTGEKTLELSKQVAMAAIPVPKFISKRVGSLLGSKKSAPDPKTDNKQVGQKSEQQHQKSEGSTEEVPKSVKVSKSKHPETAQHIQDAQAAGHPKTLTIDRAGTAQNRKDSLRGVKTQAGKDRDEYPPAMFQEGGSGASVRHINPGDNRGAGSSIGAQCRGLACGTQVTIDVVD